MMYKNLQILFLIALMAVSTLAGDKIKLKLHQPPPNRMPVTSLWQMDIENTTRESITIYLSGTASGERQSEIVDGTTKSFSVKPGKSTYGYDDFKSGNVKWTNKSIQEIIFRTGEVPEDVYTICVTAYYENGSIADNQQCITHPVGPTGEGIITLISPSDGEELKPEMPVNFVWTGTGLKGPYTLQIKEIKNGQTTEQAFSENHSIIEKENIQATNTQLSKDNKLEAGKKYAWMVITGNTKSEVWSFSVTTSYGPLALVSFVSICDPTIANRYNFTIKLKNPNQQAGGGPSSNALITSTTVEPPSASGTSITFNPPFAYNSTLFPYNTDITLTGYIVTTSPGLVKIKIYIKDQTYGNQAVYQTDGSYNLTMPACNCCESFTKSVKDLSVTGSQSNYTLNGFVKAGPRRICKIQAEMVFFSWYSKGIAPNTNSVCRQCAKPSSLYGNFTLPINPIGSLTPNLSQTPAPFNCSREIIWSGAGSVNLANGMNFSTSLLLPRANSLANCCYDSISMCIRFSFTDTTCVTCDTLITVKFKRKPQIQMCLNEKYEEGVFDHLLRSGAERDIEILDDANVEGSIFKDEREPKTENDNNLNEIEDITSCGITGYVYQDLDNSGTKQILEPGIGGETVTCVSTDGTINLTTTTVAATGYYRFANMSPGPWQLGETFPKTFIVTHVYSGSMTRTQPVGGNTYPGIVIAAKNKSSNDNNFGYFQSQPQGACDTCCSSFKRNSSYSPPVVTEIAGTNKSGYNFSTNITAGPFNFTEIRAAMISFHQKSSNPDCDTCIKSPLYFGSIIRGGSIPWSGSNVFPSTTCLMQSGSMNQNPRELVWNKIVNGQYISRPPLNPSQQIKFRLVFPPLLSNTCCCDTIIYSIKFTFEDAPPACQACDMIFTDTLIRCYTAGSVPIPNDIELQKKLNEEINDLYQNEGGDNMGENIENYKEDRKDNYKGQSAGIINIKVNKTGNVQLIIYDTHGEKMLKVHDDYLKEGDYSFDINHYNLADGVYFCKLVNEKQTVYTKVIISKNNVCNCGAK